MAVQPNPTQWQAIDAALAADRMIEAMRLYRDATNSDLASARDAVLARQSISVVSETAKSPIELPTMIQHYLNSGYAKSGKLLNYWRNRAGEWCTVILVRPMPEPIFEVEVFPDPVSNWSHQLNGSSCDLRTLLAVANGQRELYGADFGGDASAHQRLLACLQELAAESVAPPVPVARPCEPTESAAVVSADQSARATPHWRSSRTRLFALDAAAFEREFQFLPERIGSLSWAQLIADAQSSSAMAEYLDEMPGQRKAGQEQSSNWLSAATPLLWMRCLSRCKAAACDIDSIDHLFGDLASSSFRPTLAAEAETAWHLFLGLCDHGQQRRARLPWWLNCVGSEAETHIGALNPAEARYVAAYLSAIQQALIQDPRLQLSTEDRNKLLQFIGAAAKAGRWLVGLEPGS